MKTTFKYLCMGALMLSIAAPVAAQDGSKADVDALKTLIANKQTDAKSLKPFYNKNKKNAENLTAFGRAFLEAKDTANARIFAEYAMKLKHGPAYVLRGDLYALAEDGGAAAQMYDQAIYFDDKNPEAYRKYASVYRKISPAGAIAKLNELREKVPGYPVDALVGHINYISNNFDDAITAYEKVDRSQLQKMDMIEYATSCYFTGKYDKGLDMAKFGLEKEPRNSTLNRMAMFCNTEMQNYTEALKYADRLFNKSDSANISYMDYVYYGNALNGNKQHDEAIAMFKKALEQEFDNKDKRAGVIQTLANAYKGMNNYPEAIKYYDQYLNEVSKASASDYHSFAQLHVQHANTLEGDAKIETFKKADEIYSGMQQKYADIDDFISFQRARIGMYMDPESKLELAKPHYEKMIQILEAKADRSKTDNNHLIEGYRYLINYYLNIKDDTPTAKLYAEKLQGVDPENDIAKMVLGL